jgi:DNA-binding MarR family transcriptional regulator
MATTKKGATKTTEALAGELRIGVGLLLRRLRQAPTEDDLTLPEASALARLDRYGPSTASELAKREQISPQSMGATTAALEARGLVERTADPDDGRRQILSPTEAGHAALRGRRNAKTELMAAALDAEFSAEELERLRAAAPLIERLAQSI